MKRRLVEPTLLLVAVALPFVLEAFGDQYYIGFATRLVIFAIAATSLNFVVGYGGMISFGHAAFFGLGAYTTAALMNVHITTAWLAWPLAMGISALAAVIIGAISLRTRGVYFIMITLAFAQMIYYIVISLQVAGGDDGLSLASRTTLLPVDLAADSNFYWATLTLLVGCLHALGRISDSRFGRALAGLRQNEARMEALGYPVQRLKLVCFVIGSAIAGLAGALLANQNGLASPSQLYWTQSGMLLIMVILGGVGHRYGGVIGAILMLGLEELIGHHTEYVHLFVGLILLWAALYAPRGMASLVGPRSR